MTTLLSTALFRRPSNSNVLHRPHVKKADDLDLSDLQGVSDDQILAIIFDTHVPSDSKLDVNSLYNLVQNILKRATTIVDNFFQVVSTTPTLPILTPSSSILHNGTQTTPALLEENQNIPNASFTSPLCTLKQISFEMSCKAPCEDIAHKTTMSILEKVSSYEWDAKAVLALAAFAMDYGEFWMLAQNNQQGDQILAKSIAILKRVPVVANNVAHPSSGIEIKPISSAIIELNNIIKTILQVIDLIFELEGYKRTYNVRDVPALFADMDWNPADVYWIIITVVACAAQINSLTCTETDEIFKLSHFGQKINFVLTKLRNHLMKCKTQIEEEEYYRKIERTFQTPTEIMEVLKVLFFWQQDTEPQLFCGSTKIMVNIDNLRKKEVLLFISSLDVTEEDIRLLITIHGALEKDDRYKIVWVPIVQNWSQEEKIKFENLKSKMPWYVIPHFSSKVGIKFITKEWRFKGKPIIVTLSSQGKVQQPNAMNMIRLWGIKAYPFSEAREEELRRENDGWLVIVANKIEQGGGLSKYMDKEEHYPMITFTRVGLTEESERFVINTPASCIQLEEAGHNYKIRNIHYTMLPSFYGISHEDPLVFIEDFYATLERFPLQGLTKEELRMKCFPYTLKDRAKAWFTALPPDSLTTWEATYDKFIQKFSLHQKASDLRTNIATFSQMEGESFLETWKRFKMLLNQCPHHPYLLHLQNQFFYDGLTKYCQHTVNSDVHGSIKEKTPQEIFELYEMLGDSSQHKSPRGKEVAGNELNTNNDVAVQLAELTKKVKPLEQEQVNSIKSHQLKRGNDPFSNTYNSGWRNHPKFSCMTYNNSEHAHNSMPNQYQNQVGLSKQTFEESLNTFIQISIENNERQNQRLDSLEASMKRVEIQVGQLA